MIVEEKHEFDTNHLPSPIGKFTSLLKTLYSDLREGI